MSADIVKKEGDVCQELDMENVDIDNWQVQIEHYRNILKGSRLWMAVVDDVPGEAGILKALFECLGLVVDNTSKSNPDIVIHEFIRASDALMHASDYDLFIMDGNFGPGEKTGPSAAKDIKAIYPDTIIIGRSGEPKMNDLFQKYHADLVLPKDEESDLIPNFGKILVLLEKHIQDQQDVLPD